MALRKRFGGEARQATDAPPPVAAPEEGPAQGLPPEPAATEPPAPAQQHVAPARPSEVMNVTDGVPDQEVTVIGPGARLEGLLVSGGALRIEGEVKGEVRAEGSVLVANGATVEAEVHSQGLRIEGHYNGNAEVGSRIELGATAQVEANLTCSSLVVQEGAVFNGTTIMSTGASVISLTEPEAAEKKA